MSSSQDISRRPLKSRGTRWAATLAQAITRAGIRPNTISLASVLCAAVAATAFVRAADAGGAARIALYLLAALGIQARLLCNLLDGMVAVEGGHRTPSGEIFNEFPDRLSDVLILVAAGGGSPLGWLAAVLSLFTAYTRALGVSAGAPQAFHGPMAKPQRMALMTLCALILAVFPDVDVLSSALLLLCLGAAITVLRRLRFICRHLEAA